MLCGLLVFVLFHVVTPYLFQTHLMQPVCHFCANPHTGPLDFVLNVEVYIASASTIVLLVFSFAAMFFSICTIRSRNYLDGESVYRVSRTCYITVLILVVAIVAFIDYVNPYSIFDPVLKKICYFRDDRIEFLRCIKNIIDFLGLLTVALLFAAICSLVPTRVWDNKRMRNNTEERIGLAVNQVSHQMRWLGYYFYVSVIYLVIGAFFIVSYLRWLGTYFPEKEEIQTLVVGISLYNTIFYVTLLSVIVLMVAIRLRLAASWIADHRARGMTEPDKQRWLRDNGLSLPVGKIVQNSAALLSPLLVPLLSELW